MSTEQNSHQKALLSWINNGELKSHKDDVVAMRDKIKKPDGLFLLASSLIELNNIDEAKKAFSLCLKLKPDYDIARFQFSFYLLTLGEIIAFQKEITTLLSSCKTNYLIQFANGLINIANDDITKALIFISKGIELNTDNNALNNDMRILIEMFEANQTDSCEIESDSEDMMSNSLLDIYRSKLTYD